MIRPDQVSCVIPHYGTTKYLREAVESAVNQQFHEIIIVNQGTALGQLRAIADLPAVRIENMQGAFGAAQARNFGIKQCRTPYVALLDHDDILMPGYLANALSYLHNNNLRCVAANLFYIGNNSGRMGAKVSKHKDFVLPSGFLMETALAEEAGYFHRSLCEDLIFFRNIRRITYITTCSNARVLYRIHDQAESTKNVDACFACTRLLPLYYSGHQSLASINQIAVEYASTGLKPADLEEYFSNSAIAKVRAASRSAYACWLNRELVSMAKHGVKLFGHAPEVMQLAMKKWGMQKTRVPKPAVQVEVSYD